MNARICPQCQDNTIMDKVTVKDLIIDICPRCKGVYYDRGEMKKAQIHIAETIPQIMNKISVSWCRSMMCFIKNN